MKLQAVTTIVALALAAGACKKEEQPKEAPPPTATADAAAAAPTADAGPTEAERAAAALQKAEEGAAEEAKRWTDDLKKQAVALRDAKHKDAKAALTAIVAGPHRTPGHADRDAARHPVETLTFFGVTPTMTVVEVGAGGGWYTELLAPLLANRGKLIVAGPEAKSPPETMSHVYGKRLDLFLAKSPELYGKVERVSIPPSGPITFGPEGSADLVIAIREMHNWQRRGDLDRYLQGIHAVLKEGGTFGVVAHRGKEGTKGEDTAESGYLAEAWVIERVEAAGFKLAGKSEVNANPKDTKDYEKGVWTLPPNFRLGDQDREKYAAIGESDRMTLKFEKVANK